MFNKINNNLKCKYCGSSYDNLLRYGYYCINNNSDNKEIIKIQKYKCKCCNKVFSDKEDKRYKLDKYDINKRKMVITMYINNVGIRSIERILNVSNVLILNWIKNIGKNIENIINYNKELYKRKDNKKDKINILEMDELYSYVKKNKTKLKYGLLLLEKETGEIENLMLNLK